MTKPKLKYFKISLLQIFLVYIKLKIIIILSKLYESNYNYSKLCT